MAGPPLAAAAAFDPAQFANTALSLAMAFGLGALIGAERQYRQRTAGLRTNVLVAVGAAAFVDLGMRLTGAAGAVQIGAYVVSGVGFLGAGVIMKEGLNVRGLNTAATLWGSAAVGAASGADLLGEAVLIASAVLAGNTLMRPLVNLINRIPIDAEASEATYEVRVTADQEDVSALRDRIVEDLEAADYPVRNVAVERDGETSEIVATLVSTAVVAAELDRVVDTLAADPAVEHATWTSRTVD